MAALLARSDGLVNSVTQTHSREALQITRTRSVDDLAAVAHIAFQYVKPRAPVAKLLAYRVAEPRVVAVPVRARAVVAHVIAEQHDARGAEMHGQRKRLIPRIPTQRDRVAMLRHAGTHVAADEVEPVDPRGLAVRRPALASEFLQLVAVLVPPCPIHREQDIRERR